MKVSRWIQRALPLAGAATALSAFGAAAATAQNALYGVNGQYGQVAQQNSQELFEWNGRVDREIQLVMRGNNVQVDRVGNTEPRGGRARAMSALPRMDGQVNVQLVRGRGRVDVIQQPSRQNGYTTIVRIEDPGSGSDNYRLAAYWQGYASSNGDVYSTNPNGRRSRDRDRDDRDRDDRDRGTVNNGAYGGYGNVQAANQALHWSGNVDGELEIRIQNGRVSYRTISGSQPTNIRADGGNLNMPRNAANLAVSQNQGRGTVSVMQQPSSWNGYTTVIRIRDPQSGSSFYDFNLLWQ
jgi:hypothetical protein